MNVNLVIIGGNITRDPEQRFLASGSAVTNFGIAVNESWTKDGEKKEKVTFLDCKAFGKTAENITKYFKKGSRFYGHGKLDVESWEDKQSGQKRYKTVIQIESFQFCERGTSESQSSSPPPRQRPAAKEPPGELPPGTEEDPDDVPFNSIHREIITRNLTGVSIHRLA